MILDASHLRSEQLFKYYVGLSLLKGETLLIKKPTSDMVILLDFLTPLCAAEVKGLGIGCDECYFTPQKLVKKYSLDMQGEDALPLLTTLIPAYLFSGIPFTLTCTNTRYKDTSYFYIRDVLLPQLSPYIETSSLGIEPQGDVTLSLKGKYVLEEAPSWNLIPQKELVAIRGEIELADESQFHYIELSLKDLNVPVRLHHTSSKPIPLVHLDALYGTKEGYDTYFSYVMYIDVSHTFSLPQVMASFKSQLRHPRLSAELIEDILLVLGLVGGSIPGTYEETTFLLDELNKELLHVIKEETGLYVASKRLLDDL